jgi:drug/metabolite transporter (DMT)-like permease
LFTNQDAFSISSVHIDFAPHRTVSNSNNTRAAAYLVTAVSLITANDAVVKYLTQSLGVGQVLMFRGLFICALIVMLLKASRHRVLPAVIFNRWNVLRALCEVTATLCFVTGLSLLPLATAATLVWTSPIILTLLAGLIVKERVTLHRWVAVAAGFGGVLLFARPSGDAWSLAVLLPIGAAFAGASRDVLTRYLPRGLHAMHIALGTACLVTVAGAVLSLLDWRPISPIHFVLFCCSGGFFAAGYTCHVTAMRTGDLSYVAPFAYASIVFAIVLGILIWGELPTAQMLLGASLIVAAGVYILYVEHRSRKPK